MQQTILYATTSSVQNANNQFSASVCVLRTISTDELSSPVDSAILLLQTGNGESIAGRARDPLGFHSHADAKVVSPLLRTHVQVSVHKRQEHSLVAMATESGSHLFAERSLWRTATCLHFNATALMRNI